MEHDGPSVQGATCEPPWDLAATMPLIPCDEPVCRAYADIKSVLAVQGDMIPENDLWIAACALSRDLAIVSSDQHFDVVPGLLREDWSGR